MSMNASPQEYADSRSPGSGPPRLRPAPRGYFGEVIDPATYRHLLYHALSLPLALLYFTALSVGFALGLGLVVVVVGIFVLAGTLWMTLLAADLERVLGTALLGVRLERRRALRPDGLLDWARAALSDAGTYKAVLYLLLKLPFSLLVLTVAAGLLVTAVGLILAPIGWLLTGPSSTLFEFDFSGLNGLGAAGQANGDVYQMTAWSLPVMTLAGIVLLVLGVALLNLLARAWAFLSVALLTDYGENTQAVREVQALRLGAHTLGMQTLGLPGQMQGDDPAVALGELLSQGVQATSARGALVLQGGLLLAQHGLPPDFAAALSALRPELKIVLQPNGAHLLRGWQPEALQAGLTPAQQTGTLVSLPIGPLAVRSQAATSQADGPLQGAELHALYPRGTEPSRRELEFWGAISSQAAVALEITQLLRQAHVQGSEQERSRLARELHDSVAQALYGISLGTRAARAQLERNPQQAAENLDYTVQLADGATSEMKALLFSLRPDALEEGGLTAALSRLAEVLSVRYRLEAPLDAPHEPDLSAVQKGALYRIAQEAAHNAVKHARARRVSLALRPDAGNWLLQVQDDGVGFSPTQAASGTLGLKSMRERAAGIGATFDLQTQPGQGTTVRVWLPSDKPAKAVVLEKSPQTQPAPSAPEENLL